MNNILRRVLLHPFNSNSIRTMLKKSYIMILVLILIPSLLSIIISTMIINRYNRLIINVEYANSLNQIVKNDINNEIWAVVSGKKDFKDGTQYEIIEKIYTGFDVLERNADSPKNGQLIEVAKRAMSTLEGYVDKLRLQIEAESPVVENEKLMEEIRGVSQLVCDVLQQFIYAEIQNIAEVNSSIIKTSKIIMFADVFIFAAAVFLAILTVNSVGFEIGNSLLNLKNVAEKIAEGDLTVRAPKTDINEMRQLTSSLNIMAGKISGLIEENVEEQIKLQKSEMKALQAQINPHFLYNTFDTIVWLAEEERTQDVIDITMAFTNFFRISLSDGMDWITVAKEVEHVKSYLTIQKTRYSEMMDYEIDVDNNLYDVPFLKLTLQPLVENSLYHGLKYRRNRGGKIIVHGFKEGDFMTFTVEDNGVGITPEKLQEIDKALASDENDEGVAFGLYNVDRRLKLFYNIENGLVIESKIGIGTKVKFSLPIKKELQNVQGICS